MSTYRLDKLFSPRSVAVVGGSPRLTSPGRAVLKNLRSAGFKGSIGLVNPHYPRDRGHPIRQDRSGVDRGAGSARHRGAGAFRARYRRRGGRKGRRDRNRDHRRARAWGGIVGRRLREGGPCNGPATRRPKLSWSHGAARQASMPALPPACRRPGISRSSRNRARSPQAWSNGRPCTPSDFRRSSRWETRSTSISATCSISSRSIAARAQFFFTSNRSTMRANSCRRRVRPRASSLWWWSSPAGMRKARRPRRPTPERSPARTPSMTPRFAAPVCCGSWIWMSCSRRRRRSDGSSRSTASGWPSSPMAAGSACSPSTGWRILAGRWPAFRPQRCSSSTPCCRRSGHAPTLSTSPATPTPPVTPLRWRGCSKIRRTTPFLS